MLLSTSFMTFWQGCIGDCWFLFNPMICLFLMLIWIPFVSAFSVTTQLLKCILLFVWENVDVVCKVYVLQIHCCNMSYDNLHHCEGNRWWDRQALSKASLSSEGFCQLPLIDDLKSVLFVGWWRQTNVESCSLMIHQSPVGFFLMLTKVFLEVDEDCIRRGLLLWGLIDCFNVIRTKSVFTEA
jgi:hypothetical protein